MPNWVTTTLTVKGPSESLKRFKLQAPEGETQALTFNNFVPMPPSLSVDSSSDGDLGYAVFFGSDAEYAAIATASWVKALGLADATAREGLKLYLDATRPKARMLGEQYAKNIEQYGHSSWYSWSIEHWGTKWDACDVSLDREDDDELVYSFNTAWSPAEPVLAAMSAQYPELHFDAVFDEKSWAFYYQAGWQAGAKIYEVPLEHEEEEDFGDDY